MSAAVVRGVIAVLPAVTALAFWRGGYSVFMTPKATVVVVGAATVIAVALARFALTGRAALPAWEVAIPTVLYVVALVLATAAAERPLLAVAGRADRHVGLAVALATLVLFVMTTLAFRYRSPASVIVATLAAAVPVTGYALVQAGGGDPLAWNLVEGGPAVFSTLGNANFLSAWLGIVAPLAAWGALWSGWRPTWRLGCGALAAAVLMTAAATGSVQGLVAAGGGLSLLAAGWVSVRAHRLRTGAVAVLGLGGALLLAGTAAPAGVLTRAGDSLATRAAHWETAWAMASDHPMRGVGLSGFQGWFRTYESPELAATRGLERSLDSAHNVPLDLLASGGWPLLLTWLGLTLTIAVVLVRGWLRAARAHRLLLSALGGAWVAYVLQGLVSVDVAPLSVLGWTLAGLVVASAAERDRTDVRLATRGARPVAVGVLVAVSPLLIATVDVVRADHLAAQAVAAAEADELDVADRAFGRARALASWEPRYAVLHGAFLNRTGERAGALEAYEEAHRRDPRAVVPLLNVARLALALGDRERADDAYRAALERAPHSPEVRDEAARFLEP